MKVGHFFSKFGEVMDVTIILSMARVLSACAKCATLEHKREQLLTLLSRVDTSKASEWGAEQASKICMYSYISKIYEYIDIFFLLARATLCFLERR